MAASLSPADIGPPVCALVDWGTTRFRLWLVDAAGHVVLERQSADGLDAGRARGFETILEEQLGAVGAPEGLPVVLCGMVGSRQGWVEAPYLSAPAALDHIAASAVTIPHKSRNIRLLPGISQLDPAPDVMRGEETQLLGLPEEVQTQALVCLPGTHSKWAHLSGGRLTRFLSIMTGEIFAILSEHSILRHSMPRQDAATAMDDGVFRAGVCDALAAPQAGFGPLFGLRASSLLTDTTAAQSRARLSGLLIGAEIAAARHQFAGTMNTVPLMLVVSGPLAALYEMAFDVAGLTPTLHDADTLVRGGMLRAASLTMPELFRERMASHG
ncbi:MAG: 2-dehydro-3-deoxygalactonokinase [Pseudomonadota bacterium]